MGTRPTPFPFSTRASTALAGWAHVPSPVPPQRAEVTGGRSTRPPPLRWSQASIDGVAAAQPAASAKSGEWIGEGAVSASRARRVLEAK